MELNNFFCGSVRRGCLDPAGKSRLVAAGRETPLSQRLTLPLVPRRQRSLHLAEGRNPAHQPDGVQPAADGPAHAAHDVRRGPDRRRGRLPGKPALGLSLR